MMFLQGRVSPISIRQFPIGGTAHEPRPARRRINAGSGEFMTTPEPTVQSGCHESDNPDYNRDERRQLFILYAMAGDYVVSSFVENLLIGLHY
ncbi:hypothetical protein IPM65_04510 [Candidatus Roizmanbacteria bacterium]|nr:MAG: hypothetical protein IPM65_04510 [Candidatus Roizmanbacteria bacterium]